MHHLCFLNGILFGGVAVCPPAIKTLLFSKMDGYASPPNHIGPLVDQDGRSLVRLYPVSVGIPNDGFTCWTNRNFSSSLARSTIYINFPLLFVGFSNSIMGYDGALWQSPSAFFPRLWNKQRKVSIYVSCFKHFVQLITHLFPNGVAIWFLCYSYNPYRRVVGQASLLYDIQVPLWIVFRPGCYFFGHGFLFYFTL